MDLIQKLQRIAERARQRQQERRPSDPAKTVVRLPLWPGTLGDALDMRGQVVLR